MTGRRTGRIVTPHGIVSGSVSFGSHIVDIHEGSASEALWILPGFVDCHVHGGGGGDCMQGEAGTRQMAGFHAKHGTTTLLPTTMTDEVQAIEHALNGIAAVMTAPDRSAARIEGVHLEGPFISPDALGAQPDETLAPDPHLVARWQAIAPIRVATIAPEIDEAGILCNLFGRSGCKVQIGHSTATAAQAQAALELGFSGFTHLFNAMTGMHHRRPGITGCALAHASHAEIILDFQHVAEPAVRAAWRAIPGLYAITDAGQAAGMPDGDYKLGRQTVTKRGHQVLLTSGHTIAGSCLTMDQAFRNWLRLGLSVMEAAKRCSTIAADYLGLQDCGRIAHGYRADLVLMNEDFEIVEVLLDGQPVG